jgi:hypothetical protein
MKQLGKEHIKKTLDKNLNILYNTISVNKKENYYAV